MRSIFAALRRLTLPAGATTGVRIELDGITGEIRFYNAANQLVGLLSPDLWAAGDLDTPGSRVTIDPVGGVRLRSADDVLVSIMDQQGYSLRDTTTGLVVAEIRPGSLRLVDQAGTDDIELVTDSSATLPTPNYASLTEENPGTTIVAPALSLFTSPSDDFQIAHAAAWLPDTSQAGTWTPPAGFTERLDSTDDPIDDTLSVAVSTLQPATGAAATSTSTQNNWDKGLGTSVVIRGGGPVSPSFRAISEVFAATVGRGITITLDKPTGTAQDDVLVAFVTMGNDGGSIPTGWSTPDGWDFLGADFILTGTGSAASMLAVGCWVKLAGAAEPASYSVDITMGAGTKTFHGCIVAVQDADLVDGGAHIRVAGHPLRRLLAHAELTAANTTLCDFQDIPQGFDHLELIYDGQSDIGGDIARRIALRFNNDSGANYHRQITSDGVIGTALNATALNLGAIDGQTAAHRTSGQFTVFDYAADDRERSMLGHATWIGNINLLDDSVVGYWLNTAAGISRVQVFVNASGAGIVKFDAGSRAFLYGY